MKSLYHDPAFAAFWNRRAGSTGEPYKQYVLDPLMFRLVGSLKGKTVLDLGCGNGYLISSFLKRLPKRIICLDSSEENLRYARTQSSDPRVVLLKQDATKTWNVKEKTLDLVYSNMMLNEVKQIGSTLKEAHRCLKKNGKLIVSVTHPAWDLFVYAQEQAGKKSTKIQGLQGYFMPGYARYLMVDERDQVEYQVAHYHRTIETYASELLRAGFVIQGIYEPSLTKTLLKHAPRFIKYKDHPVGLVFACKKS